MKRLALRWGSAAESLSSMSIPRTKVFWPMPLARHGPTPIIVRSGSGNFQGWYRYNGEKRSIRPDRGMPIDILGGGYVVAPPSKGVRGPYQIIKGSLDDLDRLPVMQGVDIGLTVWPTAAMPPSEPIGEGQRNRTLFDHLMRAAHSCDNIDALFEVARTRNHEFKPPMEDDEVIKVARSVWGYTERGENRFGSPGVWLPSEEANRLITSDQDAFVLLAYLKSNNGPCSTFMIANSLHEALNWSRKRLSAARSRLEQDMVKRVRVATSYTGPALYRWRSRGGQNRPPILN